MEMHGRDANATFGGVWRFDAGDLQWKRVSESAISSGSVGSNCTRRDGLAAVKRSTTQEWI